MCSGEFIGKNKFLTAGHCNEEKFDYLVITCSKYNEQVGEHVWYSVTDIQFHPEYRGGGNPYDQAILTVERDIPFAPVELPENQSEVEQLLRKEDCVVFGYGMAGDNTFGTLLGISIEFNGANSVPGVMWFGGFSYPRRGDSGAGLLCRKDPDSKWIRVGTVSQAEIGLANAALLSHSLDWISEQIGIDGAKASGLDLSPSSRDLTQGTAGRKASKNPPQNRKTQAKETYNECVARLKFAASFTDDISWVDGAIARQCD